MRVSRAHGTRKAIMFANVRPGLRKLHARMRIMRGRLVVRFSRPIVAQRSAASSASISWEWKPHWQVQFSIGCARPQNRPIDRNKLTQYSRPSPHWTKRYLGSFWCSMNPKIEPSRGWPTYGAMNRGVRIPSGYIAETSVRSRNPEYPPGSPGRRCA
jgi:hypothetical protein